MIWALGCDAPKSRYRFEAAEIGHREVEHDHVRLQPCRLDNGFVSVGGFAEDGEADSVFDDQSDERAHRLVVVANEHAGRSGAVRKHSIAHLA